MSNDLTGTPHLWILDEPGILSERPIIISKIIYIPDAADDDVLFKEWDESTTVAAGSLSGKVGNISSTSTFTSTGNIPSTIADGHIFEITSSTGTSDNYGKKLVETAGDNNDVVIHEDDWTNEATSETYSWRTFATVSSIVLKAGASDASPIHLPFEGNGRIFPNLTLETIDAGTVYVYLG